MPTIFVAVGTLPPSLVELPRTWSICPPYESIACVNILAARFRPSFASSLSSPSKQRAQGMPGARCTRGLVCRNCALRRTRAYRAAEATPTSPAQWLYGLYRALPGGAGLLSPSLYGKLPAKLSASIAAPGPHDFAVRFGVFVRRDHSRLTPKRPSHPAPYVCDDRETPLLRARDGRSYNSDFQNCEAKYF